MKIVRLRRLWLIAGLYIALALWLFLTDPRKMPIVFLMVPFAMLGAALWLTTDTVIKKFVPRLKASRRLAIITCVSIVPVFLLVLNSVNQLTWRDVVLVVCLVAFLLFYSGRIHFSKS